MFCHTPKRDFFILFGLSALLFALRALFVTFGPLDLAPDEAQYWDWVRVLDWSYTTKPPLTTWLIYASTSVFGHSYFGVKFFALLAQISLPVLGFFIAKNLAGNSDNQAAGWWAFALMTCAPLIAAGGLIMSPDAASLVAWLVALFILQRGMQGGSSPTLTHWLGIGVCIGLGGLAKPSVALFYPLLGLFMLLYKRGWFKQVGVYAAGVVSLSLQAPVLYWNATHEWAMFRHVQDQADSDGRWAGLASLGDFIGGQLLVLGPVTGIALVVLLLRKRKPSPSFQELLVLFTVCILGGFLALSLQSKVQANWPVLGAVTGLVLLGSAIPNWSKIWKIALGVGLILNVSLAGLLHDTFILRDMSVKLKVKNDPTKPLLGWRGLGQQLGDVMAHYPNAWLLTTRYQTTAGLAFHTPNQPRVYYINPGYRRENHYDWTQLPTTGPTTEPVIYVSEQQSVPAKVDALYGPCVEIEALQAMRKGVVLRRAWVWECGL